VKSIEYLSGLFDGEGSFSIQVSLRQRNTRPPTIWFNPTLSVNLYYGYEVLDLFKERFGGKIYNYQRGGERRGARWHLGRKDEALRVAKELQPHLEIKKEICERFIEALSLYPSRAGVNLQAGHRAWSTDIAVRVAEIALTLNPPRARKSNKTLAYLTTFKRELERAQA
jgi:hypothetical protein